MSPPEILHVPRAFPDAASLFEILLAETPWETRVGRLGPAPRLVAWYGEGPYAYSGIHHDARPMTPVIAGLRAEVEERARRLLPARVAFGGVLLNLYRDGADSVSWHADNEPEMGPVIASVSLGASRAFWMRRKEDHRVTVDFALGAGDLLLMYGDCQRDWQHSVPKTKLPVGRRVNLTFRELR